MKVTLIGAMTVCGRISPVGYGSIHDRRRLEQARDKTGASIMGANTLRLADPEMRCSHNALPPERIRAIISGSGLIPDTGKKLFSDGPQPVIFTAADNVARLHDKFTDRAQVVPLPAGPYGLSLKAALDFLAAREVESVLLEGGARLNYNALAEGVVDEILLTVMPFISGKHGAPTLADGPEYLADPLLGLELLTCEKVPGGELFLHYRVRQGA